jgi:predicted nuclease of restriction endonuclease-like (RecB) superfamily
MRVLTLLKGLFSSTKGEDRAKYGKRLMKGLSEQLRQAGISGCSLSNLQNFRQFYLSYPQIHQTASGELESMVSKSMAKERLMPVSTLELARLSEQFHLSWSHYLVLMGLKNLDERRFYEIESAANGWKVRELERQIDSALYERLALSRAQAEVRELASQGQQIVSPRDAIKDPYILEFLGLEERPSYSENELETAIIDKLEHFLLELGKGFLFEARQKRFSFDEEHFKVDLVFYNRLLRCYVLIDLKIGKLTHQDLGQMQMYVNYFDRYVKLEDENPTIGIVLCKRKKDALIELTLPKDANIFASQYQLYLPSKEELRQQIESAVESADIEFKGDEEA